MIDLATLEANLPLILGAFAGVFVVLFVIDYFLELVFGDSDERSKEAARRTSTRAVGAGTGALGMVIAAGAAGVEAVAHAPEFVITLLGAGWIISGLDVGGFLAVALLVYIILAAARGEG